MDFFWNVILVVVGFFLLIKGADWFVEGAAGFASKLGIPQIVIGLTIVAMGTSAPEAAVSLSAAFGGSADIAVGNVVGSNILNILLILGLTCLVTPLAVHKTTVCWDLPFLGAITLLLLFFGYTEHTIAWWEGLVFLGIFVFYLFRLYRISRKSPQEEPPKTHSIGKLIVFLLLGFGAIVLGSQLTVKGATALAQAMGMSERFIGLTIVAFGTSLPELVTSLSAARKGNADIAIGNIVGSNIFNILFILGTTATIIPVPFAPNFYVDTTIALLAGLFLLAFALPKKRLSWMAGLTLLISYVAYFLYLLF